MAPTETSLGPFDVLVSRNLPPTELFIVALLALVCVAASAIAFEAIAALMSISPRRNLLSRFRNPDAGMPEPGEVRVTILIPACNDSILGSAGRDRLRNCCAQPRAPADADHGSCCRSVDLVPILVDRGINLRP